MKQRHIRPDDHLEDDDEIVLRGGELDAAVIRDDARRMFDIYGIYGISVFALRGATIDELAQQTPLVRFPSITMTTVSAIRGAGLGIEPTGRNPRHYTLVLPSLESGIEALVHASHQVWRNPYHDA